jgi:sortase A
MVSHKRLVRARERARRTGRSVEAVLVDEGALDGTDLIVAARHRWTKTRATGTVGAAAATAPLFGFPSNVTTLIHRVRMARASRIAATTLATAAGVIALEIALTLLWTEPLSAMSASRSQAQVSLELERLEQGFEAQVAGVVTGLEADAQADLRAERLRGIAAFGDGLEDGDAFGRIEIPAIGLDMAAVQGTGSGSLAKGPGHFPDTSLPGQGSTVGIAGHRTTYLAPFRRISDLGVGDEIRVQMPYGRYAYRVTAAEVVAPDASWVVGPRSREVLVLTSCHPAFSASERYVVFARKVPGAV